MKIKSEINRILSNYTVKDIVINQYKSLQQHHTILDAIKMVLSSQISIFMVYFKTNLVGYISKKGIIKAIKEKKLTASVEQYMNKEINYLDAGKTLLETEILFKTHQCQLFVCFNMLDMVPSDNFYRKLLSELDLHFLYKATRSYYGSEGQESLDPVVFFKILLVGYLNNISSDRHLIAYCSDSLSIRFLHVHPAREFDAGWSV